jgi:hypothetical protein
MNCDGVAIISIPMQYGVMATDFERYERSFDKAQEIFHDEIDTVDRSHLVVPDNPQEAIDFLSSSAPNEQNFYPVEIDSDLLNSHPALYIGRALLMHNPRFNALAPVIITPDPEIGGRFQISMFDQPYDPATGFSPGMHWNISVKAQTRAKGFGGHGDKPSGLEQGHFGAAILGASNVAIATAIVQGGDRGTHDWVIKAGVAESMGRDGILPVAPITRDLPSRFRPMMAYWHEKIQDENGPLGGDFPESTRLMLGAGLSAIGRSGLVRVEKLVKDAVRGAA